MICDSFHSQATAIWPIAKSDPFFIHLMVLTISKKVLMTTMGGK